MAGTIVANTINTDTGLFSTNNAYSGIAKAWVQLSGSSSPTINGAFNISSITRNGTGDYTFNFTTAMPNTNYSVVAATGISSASTNFLTAVVFGKTASPYYIAPTTSAFSVMFVTSSGSQLEPYYGNISVFSA